MVKASDESLLETEDQGFILDYRHTCPGRFCAILVSGKSGELSCGNARRSLPVSSVGPRRTGILYQALRNIFGHQFAGKEENESWYVNEIKVCQKYKVQHYDLGMSADQTPSDSTIKALLVLFKKAPRPILIHCKAGADRSGLAAALWKMVVDGFSKAEAQKELSIWYGHMPLGPTQALDDFIKQYEMKR